MKKIAKKELRDDAKQILIEFFAQHEIASPSRRTKKIISKVSRRLSERLNSELKKLLKKNVKANKKPANVDRKVAVG
jgi:hypothetical protein